MSESKENNMENELEFIAFRVENQEYCINIMSVREIRGWTQETSLPLTPGFVRGVINLRGSVVPIIDLATRLGLAAPDPTARHVIIISQVGQQIVGLLVDAVSDILTTNSGNIQSTPEVASQTAREFVRGVLPIEERMINLIDLESVLPEHIVEDVAA